MTVNLETMSTKTNDALFVLDSLLSLVNDGLTDLEAIDSPWISDELDRVLGGTWDLLVSADRRYRGFCPQCGRVRDVTCENNRHHH